MREDPSALHVVILCDFAVPTGGSQKVAIESAKALAAAGVRVTFIHAVAGRDPSLDQAGIACIDLGMRDVWDRPITQAAVAGVWDRAVRRTLARILAEQTGQRRTILHLHQWTRAFSPSVFAAALDTRLPFVVTAHDYFLACPNGVYYRFEHERPCDLRPLTPACILARCDPKSPAHKVIRLARSFATRAAFGGRSFDVVHVSDRGRDILTPLLPPTLRHHRVDNPIDVRHRPPADIGSGSRLAFIGRLTREKGVVVAAQAARRADCRIAFVGEGPAEADIRTANPAAEMLGWRSGPEVEALLAGGIKAVVAPSLWDETGPLTIGEAAASGVASIASRRCGGAERVVDGVTGLVVEPAVEPLAVAMRSLDHAATAQTFGRAAYEAYWAAPPNLAAHAGRLIALYEEMAARPITRQDRRGVA